MRAKILAAIKKGWRWIALAFLVLLGGWVARRTWKARISLHNRKVVADAEKRIAELRGAREALQGESRLKTEAVRKIDHSLEQQKRVVAEIMADDAKLTSEEMLHEFARMGF